MNHTGYAQVFEEFGSGGALNVSYTLGDDVLSQSSSSGVRQLMYDGHGSTRLLTNETGVVSDRYDFDAYGVAVGFAANSQSSTATSMLYSGEQFDAGLQMYNLRARYMNTSTGRFWTMDSYEGDIGEPMSLHKYLYTHGNPVNGTDPSGHALLTTTAMQTMVNGLMNGLSTARAYGSYAGARVLIFELEAMLFQYMAYAEIALGVVSLTAMGAQKVDDLCTNLLNNLDEVPDGPGNRGVFIENKAGANLGGNVEGIDHLDDGLAIQIKSRDLDSPEKLLRQIESDLDDLDGIEKRTLKGGTSGGTKVSIPPGSIRQKALIVAIPENRSNWASSPILRSGLEKLARSTRTFVRIVPVRNWRGK